MSVGPWFVAWLVIGCAADGGDGKDSAAPPTPTDTTSAGTTPPGTTPPGTTPPGTTPAGTTRAGTTPTGTTSAGTTPAGTTPTGTTSVPTTGTVSLVEGGIRGCADPDARDVSVFERHELGWVSSAWTGLRGAGVAAGDLDGDGLPEVVRTRPDGLELWSMGLDGVWTETGAFDHLVADRAAAASLADFDADGDLDLFVGRFGAANLLLRNDGPSGWTDVAASLGLERFPYLTLASAWGDLDLDGDLDLIAGNYGETPPRPEADRDPSRLYLGSGGGGFEDVSHWLPERVQEAYTFMHAFVDTNDDLYPELVAITDFFYVQPSAIYVNQAGEGFELDDYNGFQLGFNGMGVGIADVNGDRIPDFVQSSTVRLSMMLSIATPDNPSGALWIEYAGLRGLEPDPYRGHTFGWGTEWADMDNDGDLDVPMLWGYWDDFPQLSPLDDPRAAHDALWLADDLGSLRDVAGEWGFDDPEPSRGLVVADLDGNGALDVVKGTINGPTIVLLQRCSDASWLGVELTDHTTANRDAIGARVVVSAGARSWLRWVTAGSTGMFSGGPPTVHVGLDAIEVVDHVEVRWPDGEVSVFDDVDARQTIGIVRR